jgi:hypothetical protein
VFRASAHAVIARKLTTSYDPVRGAMRAQLVFRGLREVVANLEFSNRTGDDLVSKAVAKDCSPLKM